MPFTKRDEMARVFSYVEVDSTQDEAKRLIANGVQPPFFVVAEKQTKGRGRLGRSWVSEEGGIWLTYAMIPAQGINPLVYSYGAALAIKDVVEELGISTRLRWPNDVFVLKAKVCGILCEADYYGSGSAMRLIRLGIGLNVNNDVSKVIAPYPVISLKMVTGYMLDTDQLKRAMISRLEEFLSEPDKESILKRYQSALDIIGKTVRIKTKHSSLLGKALGLDEEGLLVIEEEGTKEKLHLVEGELEEE
ncbi:MAG: biotin--[acetyl-CoA-carboxylase] ligase [Conexivisphaerales archaeon]